MAEDHFGPDDLFGKPNHAAAAHCGQSSVFECFDLKHDPDVGGDLDSLTIGQG